MRKKIVTATIAVALLIGVAAGPASAGKRMHVPTPGGNSWSSQPDGQRWD